MSAVLRVLVSAVLVLSLAGPVRALGLIRDADIEYGLGQLAKPVLRAAGLSSNAVRILVINDSSLNAFVADTQHIFIHSGLILKLGSAEELQAVIAHEAAHITNGHLTRRAGNLRSARTAAGLGFILAAAAAASGGDSRAAAGLAIGTSSSAQRLLLAHNRAEEASADQSAARYMVRAGIDPAAAVRVFEIFRGQELLAETRQDPYARTHPFSRDRMRAMQAFANAHGGKGRKDPGAEYWFSRAKGKLSAFTRNPKWTLRRSKDSASRDIQLMREAAAYHRQSNAKKALTSINGALKLRSGDPFLQELKGQILLESRQFGAAVQAYKAAVAKAPNHPLILGGYGRALLAAGQPGAALPVLERARVRDFRDPRVLRDLAVAYSRGGRNGMASVVTAERYALQGRMKDAALHAKRAEKLLPRGSGPWQRAVDLSTVAKRALKRR